jgi:hypothetical protein
MRHLVTLVTFAAVLTVPAAALATRPPDKPPTSPPGKPASTPPSTPAGKLAGKPTVMFVVRGTVSAFTAASGATNGSITITVSGGNEHATKLFANGAAKTFVLSSNTRVVSTGGISSGDKVLVKIRAPTHAPASTVSSTPAKQIVETG